MLDVLAGNLLRAPILFFFLGIGARLVRSDLTIPEPLPKLFSLYLLWAIGFKGGVKLAESGVSWGSLSPLVVAMILSALLPLAAYPLLRVRLNRPDSAATAAAYGSVSVVTFIAASNFLDMQGVAYGGQLVAALALMEFPAIITGVMVYRWREWRAGSAEPPDHAPTDGSADAPARAGGPAAVLELFREAVTSGPVFLLVGSLAVGALTGERGWQALEPFCEDIFHGVLVLFLLESGMRAAARFGGLGKVMWFALGAGILLPLANAAVGVVVSRLLGLDVGDAFLLTILCASASYIAVPAAMRLAMPEANEGVYLPMALAITFPFNIALGIPVYLAVVRWATG